MAPPNNTHLTISSPNQPRGPTENGTCFIHANPTNLNLDHPILKASLRPITLKFQDVAYTVNNISVSNSNCFSSQPKSSKTLLNGVTGMVKPGELMAMLGPSGSGKTTLLTALSGRYLAGKISGTISYNERPFSGSMKRKIGFVSQDDVLYPHLTVLETLTYAALLRLPGKLTNDQKMEQVDFVIKELGLGRCRNGVVGGPLLRGISGGERKRVSIGQEMLINPSLLFLDEPTSGLDSTTAGRIVATLKGLARGGRTVVMTVHQPSGRIYRTLDKVVVLSEGSPIYTGPARGVVDYFGSIGYFPGFEFVNPAEFLLDLANGIVPEMRQEEYEHEHEVEVDILEHQHDEEHNNSVKQFLLSSYKKSIYPSLKDEIRRSCHLPSTRPPPSRTAGSLLEDNQMCTSWWTQFKVLSKRGLKERKHESYSGLRIFQVMSVSILSGLLWWHSDSSHIQDQVGLLFFFSIFWGFFPLFNAIFAFPSERPILSKERASRMYYLSSYYFARTVGDLPMELILPTIFVAVTYWMGGLKPSLPAFIMTLLVVLFNVLVSQGLGLALGAVLMDMKPASTLASVTMLVFLLAGGYYIQRIPRFMRWLKFVSFSHYCYKLLVGVQYSGNEVYECDGPNGMKWCRVWDFPAIKYLGIENMMWDVAALAVMLIGYRLLAYVALRFGPTH